jgi:Ala-tRNA(Pro) deacylase
MPVQKLKQFLDAERVKYACISHSPAYTASEIAQSVHIPGRELAKVVMVTLDGRMAMAVLPANRKVNLSLLREAANADQATLATEDQFRRLFPDCETGAMPPFGNLYGMEVYGSASLTEDDHIAFNAGSHTEVMRLAYADFARLVKPKVAVFTD